MFEDLKIRPGEEGSRVALHDLEADIMDVVWSEGWGEFAVRDVVNVLQEERDIAYTTVMTTVKRLFDKGLLSRQKDGRRYLYSPKMNRSDFHARVATEVMKSLPDSSRDAALAALVGESSEVDPSTLERLEEMISKRREELAESDDTDSEDVS